MKGLMLIFLMLSVLVLLGCASVTGKTVLIPVEGKLKCMFPVKPSLPITSLKTGDGADIVMKAYVASLYIDESYIKDMKMLATTCSQ
jgi:hypothetical protein